VAEDKLFRNRANTIGASQCGISTFFPAAIGKSFGAQRCMGMPRYNTDSGNKV